MTTTTKRVGILGVYGKGNLGDEAILHAILGSLERLEAEVSPVVFCSRPGRTSEEHGVAAYARSPLGRFGEKVRILASLDLLIVGGGTLLYDQGGFLADVRSIGALLFWPLLARMFGIPIMAWGQGIGPVTTRTMELGTVAFLELASVVTLRDAQSYAIADQFVRGRTHLEVTVDPVLGLKHRLASIGSRDQLNDAEDPISAEAEEPYAVLAMREPERGFPVERADFLRTLAHAVVEFQSATDLRLVVMPVRLDGSPDDDLAMAVELKEELEKSMGHRAKKGGTELAVWTRYNQAASILQGAEMVISSRLHGLLLAAMRFVPVVGIGQGGKIEGCLRMLYGNRSSQLPLGDPTDSADQLLELFLRVWQDRASHSELIAGAVASWAESEARNVRHAATLLGLGLSGAGGDSGSIDR